MHNHFLLPSSKLRQCWKNLRKQASEARSDADQIQMILDWWKLAPYGKPYLDYLNPQSWPDPWMLLENGTYDPATVSLGMFYTLMLLPDTRWNQDRLKLCMVRSQPLSHENLTCVIDGTMLLGFEFGKLSDLAYLSDFLILHSYNYDSVRRQLRESKIPNFTEYTKNSELENSFR